MDELEVAKSLGFTLPGPAYIFGAILFGIIGYAAYRYGKRASAGEIKWIGVALMLYPYVIGDTLLLYIVGSVLCVGLYVFRR